MTEEGTPLEEARSKIWMVDSKGLIVNNRPKGGISGHKKDFAKDHAPIDALEDVVKAIKPTAIIGTDLSYMTSDSIIKVDAFY